MNTSHHVADRERLDHQRSRIEHILAQEILSPAMHERLQQLLDDISRKLQSPPGGAGGSEDFGAPGRGQTH